MVRRHRPAGRRPYTALLKIGMLAPGIHCPLADQAGRIEQRPEVMIDETASVADLAHGVAQRVFWRRERTRPASKPHPAAPHHRQ